MSFYLLITTKENYSIDVSQNFKYLGLPFVRNKTTNEMRPGDGIIYYIKGIKKIAAVTVITGKPFIDYTPIWNPNICGEIYPSRIETKPEIVYESLDDMVDFKPLASEISIIKDSGKWGVYLQSCIRKISEQDYAVLKENLQKNKRMDNKDD